MRFFFLLLILFCASCAQNANNSNNKVTQSSVNRDSFKEGLKNSILRLTVSYQTTNHYYPWRYNSPSSRSGQAIVIGKNRVLTLASYLYQARLVEARLNAEPSPTVLKIVYVDLDRNIAILEGELPPEAQVLELPKESQFVVSDKVRYFWKTDNGRFLEGGASFDRPESYRQNPSFQSQIWYSCSSPTTNGGFGEPVFHDDKLVGLTIYGDDSRMTILPNETINKSLKIFEDPKQKTSMAGFQTVPCTQKYLRLENNLKPNDGGCYVSRVFDQGCGSKTIQKGDILLKIAGQSVDAWGRYKHPKFEDINYTHLIGNYNFDTPLMATIMRNGQMKEITLDHGIIDDTKWLVPRKRIGEQSKYFIYGGFIFQKFSYSYLKAWGSGWDSKAPENLLTILGQNRLKVKTDEKKDIVLLSHTLAHPINRGIQYLGRQVITSVNGEPISGINELYEIFSRNEDKLTFTLSPGDIPVIVSPKALSKTNKEIQQMYNIPKMKNL